MVRKIGLSFALLCLSWNLWAKPPAAIYQYRTQLDLPTAYQRVYQALEKQQFWVVFDADLGKRMAQFKERWGEDYNRQGLTGARSLVFCNLRWTNALASADPDLLALCPLHLSLYAKDSWVNLVMVRPSVLAVGSEAQPLAKKLEEKLIGIIQQVLKAPAPAE